MSRRTWSVAVVLATVITLLRVASTHRVISPTFDEPIHVAAGHEYLAEKQYKLDVEHPPLARILSAWPFRKVKPVSGNDFERGNQLYQSSGDYLRGVARSRRGNLLFLAIALVTVTLWARHRFGDAVALTACALFAMLPPILAHAGLATTDMAATAGYCAAMFVLDRWIDRPSAIRTIAFGITVGLALVTKHSFAVYFAISLLVVMIARRRAPLIKGLAAFCLAMLIVWSVYRFDMQRLETFSPDAQANAVELFGPSSFILRHEVPAPGYISGLMNVVLHNRRGHPAYFMGETSEHGGWWAYFPVLFGIKTPIPLMILAAAGSWFLLRRREHRDLIILPIAMMAVAMTSNINIGVRHILPIYAPLSILAAIGVIEIARTRAKPLAIILAAWLVIGSVATHPDYLPWANAFGGREPQRIATDSNFDWGQDFARLRTVCRRLGIHDLGVFLFGTTDVQMIGLPPVHGIDQFNASTGWIAISESAIVPAQARDRLAFFWLTSAYRYQRVGKTIRLYHVTD
jgi:4-amino-4-deoxy-L-arabinose transferase-like glycosyltransferase